MPTSVGHSSSTANGDSRKPRVYTREALHSDGLALARKHFDLVLHDDPAQSNWLHDAEGVLLRNSVMSEQDVKILASHKLRYVSKQGTGVDNIAADALKAHGVPLMNTPGVNAQAVAELALGLIMSLTTTIDRRIRRGDSVTKLDGWEGQTLHGRTLGVIGGGNIGLLVGKMFHAAFQGPVILFDPYQKSLDAWESAVPNGHFRKVDTYEELLRASDIVTLHVPLTPSTTNMIGRREFEMMKPTAILINTARGGIVDEDELVDALSSGKIFGAGLDAFVSEPPSLQKYPKLCASDRVVLVPHFGAATEAAQQDTCRAMVENLVAAFTDGSLPNRYC